MKTTIALIAVALSGCATPPAQVRTVSVPEPQSARLEHNLACSQTMKDALAIAKFTLDGVKECEKNPAGGCVKMQVAHQVNEQHGYTDAATVCLKEANVGAIGLAGVHEYVAIADEIVRRLKRLDKRFVAMGAKG